MNKTIIKKMLIDLLKKIEGNNTTPSKSEEIKIDYKQGFISGCLSSECHTMSDYIDNVSLYSTFNNY